MKVKGCILCDIYECLNVHFVIVVREQLFLRTLAVDVYWVTFHDWIHCFEFLCLALILLIVKGHLDLVHTNAEPFILLLPFVKFAQTIRMKTYLHVP